MTGDPAQVQEPVIFDANLAGLGRRPPDDHPIVGQAALPALEATAPDRPDPTLVVVHDGRVVLAPALAGGLEDAALDIHRAGLLGDDLDRVAQLVEHVPVVEEAALDPPLAAAVVELEQILPGLAEGAVAKDDPPAAPAEPDRGAGLAHVQAREMDMVGLLGAPTTNSSRATSKTAASSVGRAEERT